MSGIDELYQRFLERRCSRQEAEILLEYFLTQEGKADLARLIEAELQNPDSFAPHTPEADDAIASNRMQLREIIKPEKSKITVLLKNRLFLAACSLAALLSVALYFYYESAAPQSMITLVNDSFPGGNRATLTLSDGNTIDLGTTGNGILARQGGTSIRKTADGQLTYEAETEGNNPEPTAYNTVSTPKGGQYQIILPDGSKVWLNAASTIRYPVKFQAHERKIEFFGEGYFQVIGSHKQPFIISSKNQQTLVLGTELSISAYDNDPYQSTTLVTGSIKVKEPGKGTELLLQPGQQARLNGEQLTVHLVDAEKATAWKDGLFNFKNTELASVIRQVERWYNVEADYKALPIKRITGIVSRDIKLSEFLEALEVSSNVKFIIKGRRIVLEE